MPLGIIGRSVVADDGRKRCAHIAVKEDEVNLSC